MLGICLSYDDNHDVLFEVLKRFFTLWPSHPIQFRIPFNDRRPVKFAEFGSRVNLIQTPRPIHETIDHLTADLPTDQWVFWLLDDKYIDSLNVPIFSSLMTSLPQVPDNVIGVQLASNYYSVTRFLSGYTRLAGHLFLVKRSYSAFWQPHFTRVASLRTYLVDGIHSDDNYLTYVEGKESMPGISRTLNTPFTDDAKVWIHSASVYTFQETLHANKISSNFHNMMYELKGQGISGKEVSDHGWLINADDQVVKFHKQRRQIFEKPSSAEVCKRIFRFHLLGFINRLRGITKEGF